MNEVRPRNSDGQELGKIVLSDTGELLIGLILKQEDRAINLLREVLNNFQQYGRLTKVEES